MSKQRIIKDSFWTDPYVEDLDPMEKLLFLHLLTNPQVNVLGIYEIRVKRIAYETGIDKDMVEKIFDRFISDGKLLRSESYVIIINFTKNQSDNPSIIKGMQRVLDSLPPACIQTVTACTQLLTYLTLLNLTLPNSTSPNSTEVSESDEKIDHSPEKKIKKQTDAQKIIDVFYKSVNPTIKWNNKTTIKACDEMVKMFGLEKVLQIAKVSCEHQGQKFCPTITTPYELQEKMAKLKVYFDRMESDSNKINSY